MRILGVIPARYASTRFPGKPLIDIAGQSMIMRVYRQAAKASLLTSVVVATDDKRIGDEVEKNKGKVILTSKDHTNGTERCAEVLSKLNETFDYVINIQGDEPLIDPAQINALAAILTGDVELGTLVKRIDKLDQLKSDSVVKVVVNSNKEALYFSRNIIPHVRGVKLDNNAMDKNTFFKHVGIYAYRVDILNKIVKLPIGTLERIESLEQLRWLENGYRLSTVETNLESPSIDTPEDLEYVLDKIS